MKHTQNIYFLIIAILGACHLGCSGQEDDSPPHTINPDDASEWVLSWFDDFSYTDREELLKIWQPRNGHSGNTSVLSSSWNENIEVGGGTVRLVALKENRLNNLNWTAASMWTKEKFQYGYLECRYKYAAAEGTNNSFWLMPDQPNSNKDYEIDINEGHYPAEVNTNIHIYTSGKAIKTNPKELKYSADFSKDYHLFGLEWTQDELIFYVDRKEIRREKNTSCFSATPLILSLAIISWAGTVTDAIDGKYMEVDYVRVYKPLYNNNKDN